MVAGTGVCLEPILVNRRFYRMERVDLEKWVSSENVIRFRDRLTDPSYDTLHVQYRDLLNRELAKIQAIFPK